MVVKKLTHASYARVKPLAKETKMLAAHAARGGILAFA